MEKSISSVCMITNNHESYICEGIVGALIQKTNFQIEVIIDDDAYVNNNQTTINIFAKK